MAAEKVTPEAIAFIVRHTSGVICMPVVGDRLDELRDPADGRRQHRSAAHGVHRLGRRPARRDDRDLGARTAPTTIRAIVEPGHRARGPVAAGHVFPLRYREGGVLKRAGHTEASVDLARLAGLYPGRRPLRDRERGRHDGPAARPGPRSRAEHGLKIISIADLIEYRREHETLVSKVAEATIPTPHGEFRSYAYESSVDGRTHVALVLGDIGDGRGRPHPRALGVPDRRRVRLAALRLRRAAPALDGGHRRGGPRRRPVHPRPRGPGDRPDPQAAGLRAPGSGPRHGRGERRAGVRRRIRASTGSARRSSSTSAFGRCAC